MGDTVVNENMHIKSVKVSVIDDTASVFIGEEPSVMGNFITIDTETTGLYADEDEIIELAALKVVGGEIVDSFFTLIKPKRLISQKIIDITGITNEMITDAPSIESVFADFKEFCGNNMLVAHNAKFDYSFVTKAAEKLEIEFSNSWVDTLLMSRLLMPDAERYKLYSIAKELDVSLNTPHRAFEDAEMCAGVFLKLRAMMFEKGIRSFSGLNAMLPGNEAVIDRLYTTQYQLFAVNETGESNLRRILELIEHYQETKGYTKILKSELLRYSAELEIRKCER